MSTIDPTRPDIAYFWPERGRSLAIAEISLGSPIFMIVTPQCYATSVCAVIVCPSHAGIVTKRLNVGSRKECHMIAHGL